MMHKFFFVLFLQSHFHSDGKMQDRREQKRRRKKKVKLLNNYVLFIVVAWAKPNHCQAANRNYHDDIAHCSKFSFSYLMCRTVFLEILITLCVPFLALTVIATWWELFFRDGWKSNAKWSSLSLFLSLSLSFSLSISSFISRLYCHNKMLIKIDEHIHLWDCKPPHREITGIIASVDYIYNSIYVQVLSHPIRVFISR